MPKPLQLAINGADGRMGRALQELLRDDARFTLAAKVSGGDAWRAAPGLDVVVDFSTPGGFGEALAHCEANGVALVSGTTGLDAAQWARLGDAGARIPVLHAANFSLGIALLTRLLREAAAAVPDWDLEILESHHARKTDAPSGTALALGRAAAEARGQDFDGIVTRARDGQVGPRKSRTIGFASIRAGDIVGEHTALLASAGERVELSHRATDRMIFARGALAAAAWLAGRRPGRYTLDDVLAS